MQQSPQSQRASNRPGRMTAVMRAVSQQAGPKILRIGVVQGGKVVDERLVKDRGHVTIGPSEKAMFVVPSRKVPANFKLFELIGSDYHLNFLDGMTGRVALKSGVSELAALGTQAKVVEDKAGNFKRVRLTEDSRGKVVVGETTFLFQFVAPPPVQPKPQLPMSVRTGVAGDIDWFTTIVAAFSFLLHFFFVALVYSDWMDPVVRDEDAVVSQLVESVKSLPPPPPVEKVKSEVDQQTTAAAVDPKAPTANPQQQASTAGQKSGGTGTGNGGGGTGSSPGTAATNPGAADLASALAETQLEVLGAYGSGNANTADVFSDSGGNLAAASLDAQGQNGTAIGSGGGIDVKGGTGSGSVGPLSQGGGGGTGGLSTGGVGPGPAPTTNPGTEQGPKKDVKVITPSSVSGCDLPNAKAVVGGMRGGFKGCYMSGLSSNPDLAGAVTLTLTVGPTGAVSSVAASGGLAPIQACLKGVAKSGVFSPPECGSAVVSIPVQFVKQ